MKQTGILTVGPYKYNYPTNWAELTRAQLLKIFALQQKYITNTGAFVLHFIWIALKFKPHFFRSKKQHYLITQTSAENKITIAHNENILGWYFDKNNTVPYLLKWFLLRGRIYVGPYRRLTKINVSELCFGMYYHQQFHQTQNKKYIYNLIDVLYRPVSTTKLIARIFSSNPKGDIRVPLNDYMHEKRAARFAKLPEHYCILILAQWSAAQQQFTKQFPRAFQKGGNKKSNPRDMSKFLIGAAGDKFGTIEQAEVAPAEKVFEFVEMNLQQIEKLKEKNGTHISK